MKHELAAPSTRLSLDFVYNVYPIATPLLLYLASSYTIRLRSVVDVFILYVLLNER